MTAIQNDRHSGFPKGWENLLAEMRRVGRRKGGSGKTGLRHKRLYYFITLPSYAQSTSANHPV
jgi:hypothetical protein